MERPEARGVDLVRDSTRPHGVCLAAADSCEGSGPHNRRRAGCRLAAGVDSAGAWIVQALLDPAAHDDAEALDRNGFKYLTDLRFLVHMLRRARRPT